MEQASSHGGKRGRSGRKPVEDKKIPLTIYINKSRVEALGVDNVKQFASDAVEEEFKKRDKK
jgi:hypothetical protein